jgi:hypothetical protein
MAWINRWTALIAVLFIAHMAVSFLQGRRAVRAAEAQ